MFTRIPLFLLLMGLLPSLAGAGGGIGWSDAREHISKSDPGLVLVIERVFSVNQVGWARRLGPGFGERSGERMPPYEFEAVEKATGKKYRLRLDQSDDFGFTGRFRVAWALE